MPKSHLIFCSPLWSLLMGVFTLGQMQWPSEIRQHLHTPHKHRRVGSLPLTCCFHRARQNRSACFRPDQTQLFYHLKLSKHQTKPDCSKLYPNTLWHPIISISGWLCHQACLLFSKHVLRQIILQLLGEWLMLIIDDCWRLMAANP